MGLLEQPRRGTLLVVGLIAAGLALAARVAAEPDAVLREVAANKLRWLLHAGRPIPRETWDFWNSLAAGRSSSSP